MGRLIEFDELRQLEKDVLSDFADLCAAEGLEFWLAYGTLIGSVREGDMVPWDDDIDVYMMSDHYYQLIDLLRARDGWINDHVRLVSPEIDAQTYAPWGKIIDTRTLVTEEVLAIAPARDVNGVWVDIFPLFPVHPDPRIQRASVSGLNALYLMMRLASLKQVTGLGRVSHMAARVLGPLAHQVGYQKLGVATARWMRHVLGQRKTSDRVFCSMASDNEIEIANFATSIMSPLGDKSYPIPCGYDEILSAAYGDYMTPPSAEHRTYHPMRAEWVEE